nr:MAG TPA: stabilization protein [Caudoviricetes sp.]
MSTVTQLICNKFAGIRRQNAMFNENAITAQDMQNIELYFTGTNGGVGIRTMKGNISINNSLEGSEKIINIFESTQNEQTYFFVHTETETQGKFYRYNQNLNVLELKKSGLSVTGVSQGFDVQQGWSDLFFFTNGEEMFTIEIGKKDDSNNLAEIKDMVLYDRDSRQVKGLGAALFANRLWIFNKNILWYSMNTDIYDFSTSDAEWETSAGYIETLKNITAIHCYLDSLAIFYEDSSELLSVSSGTISRSDESPGGCAGVNALVFHDTDLYFYDHTKKSVFSFKQVINGEKTLGENVAIEIQEELLKIDINKADNIQALSVFLSERNEIWWILPTADENYSTILIYDYLKGEWVKRKSQKINAIRVIDGVLYSAGNDGNILEEYNSNTFNGEYIEQYYNCSPLNLGADNTLKVLVFPPRVSFDLPYSNNFYVKYIKNYNTFKKPKIKYIKSKVKNFLIWGVGLWGINYWASKATNAVGKFPNATFKILEICIYTTKLTENFAIKNMEFSKIKVKQV